MRIVLLILSAWLVLALPAAAQNQELRLEFVQEGDPTQPRALIVIHGEFGNRDSLRPWFERWGEKSWALRQFCSVYSYQFPSTLTQMAGPDELAEDLYSRLQADRFDASEASGGDSANPYRDVKTDDPRQPQPTLSDDEIPILVVGYGYGALVADKFSNLSEGRVKKICAIGAPSAGIPQLELIFLLCHPSFAQAYGISALTASNLQKVSAGWEYILALGEGRVTAKKPEGEAKAAAQWVGVLGKEEQPVPRIFERAMYGPGTPVGAAGRGNNDRILTAAQKLLGTLSYTSTVEVKGSHEKLLDDPQLLSKLYESFLDKNTLYDYLFTRQQIELYFAGSGSQPSGVYWDERESDTHAPQFRQAFATQAERYYWMWLSPTAPGSGP